MTDCWHRARRPAPANDCSSVARSASSPVLLATQPELLTPVLQVVQRVVTRQLLGRAGPRQLKNPTFGLTHNLGGAPHSNVSAISVIGRYN